MGYKIRPQHWMCQNFPLGQDGKPIRGDVKRDCAMGYKVSANTTCERCFTGKIDWDRVNRVKASQDGQAHFSESNENDSETSRTTVLPRDADLKSLYLACLTATNAQGIIIGNRAGIKNLAKLQPLIELGLIERKEYSGSIRYRIPQVGKRRKEHLSD